MHPSKKIIEETLVKLESLKKIEPGIFEGWYIQDVKNLFKSSLTLAYNKGKREMANDTESMSEFKLREAMETSIAIMTDALKTVNDLLRKI